PKSCVNRVQTCAEGYSHLLTGDEVVVGKRCGEWTYVQYIGTRVVTKGWVDGSRLRFVREAGTGSAKSLFTLTRGRGIPVCEAYLQRLNVTDYRQNLPSAAVPYCGVPENDEIPGFTLLHRVPLSSQQIVNLSGRVYTWWERPNPHLTADWTLPLDQVTSGGVFAWTYDPPLDVNNDGKHENIIAWRGYGLSGAVGRCGEPINQNYTWSVRWQQLLLIMSDDQQIDESRTATVFGRASVSGSRRKNAAPARHPFYPVGISITPVVYKGTTYLSAFFDDNGDYEGRRQGNWKLWNVMGLLKRSGGATQEVCEYRLRGDDYPKAHTGLER